MKRPYCTLLYDVYGEGQELEAGNCGRCQGAFSVAVAAFAKDDNNTYTFFDNSEGVLCYQCATTRAQDEDFALVILRKEPFRRSPKSSAVSFFRS